LEKVREKTGENLKVKIMSENNFPTSAGLASSASGFSALSTAINEALDLGLSKRELSQLSRLGSGSSTRSIFGGFVKWHKGEKADGSDSYAEQLLDDWPDFKIIFCITSEKEKKVKSRAGMAASVGTSPMYSGWLLTIEEDIQEFEKALQERDFSQVGKISERNCLKMHSVMITTKPSLIYWNEATIRIMKSIMSWREEGLESYFTIDAGPQVKIICLQDNVEKIEEKCKKVKGVKDVIITRPGPGSRVVNEHLF
jgi:diphosphomevalonate decarboxylase